MEQHFRTLGAYSQADDPPNAPPPACGMGALSDPSTNGWLMQACISLLEAKDSLRGIGSLNWSSTSAMASWDGITLGTGFNIPTMGTTQSETGSIVQGLSLSNKSLTGTIPEELGNLYGLTTLKLNNNSLTGTIPETLEELTDLTELKLAGNTLTGYIPLGLKDIANNDLATLDLPFCQPPAPDDLSTTASGESSVSLSWNAVSNTNKYRVGFRLLSAYGLSSRSHTIRYKQTEPSRTLLST